MPNGLSRVLSTCTEHWVRMWGALHCPETSDSRNSSSHADETCEDVFIKAMVFTVMLMDTMTSHIAKQCFEKCSDCVEVSPPRDTFWRRVVVWGSGSWMSAFTNATGLRSRSALPVRREVLDRMTVQRLDRKRLLRASIFAVKLWQDERVPQALSCLANVSWRQYKI